MHVRWVVSAACAYLVLVMIPVAAAPGSASRFTSVFRSSRNAVVVIRAMDQAGEVLSQGSGFVASIDGHIVTNLHVVQGAASAAITYFDGSYHTVPGCVAVDPSNDLALLSGPATRSFLTTVPVSSLSVGDEVVAIGTPRGLEATLTNGIVSAVRRIEGTSVVQTSAAISPGSSGGPLLNLAGQVVGVTTFQLKDAQNLNFAVSSDHVSLLLREAKQKNSDVVPFPATNVETTAETESSPEDEALTAQQVTEAMERVESLKTAREKLLILQADLSGRQLTIMARAALSIIAGDQYRILAEPESAVEAYEAALTHTLNARSHAYGLYGRLCQTYLARGRDPEALDMCAAALTDRPANDPSEDYPGEFVDDHLFLARANLNLGRVPAAVAECRKALDLGPQTDSGWRRLVSIIRESGDRMLLREAYDLLKANKPALVQELIPHRP